MPHMVAQEHMGFVDALRYGTVRTDATIAAALAAIGSTPATLVLTQDGDGIWTINVNLIIPFNVQLWIPVGVVVNVTSGHTLTIRGNVVTFGSWKTGAGTYLYDYNLLTLPVIEIGYLSGQNLNFPGVGRPLILGPPGGQQIYGFTNNSGDVSFRFAQPPQDPAHTWDVGITTAGAFFVGRGEATNDHLVMPSSGLGISNGTVANAPTHLLQLMLDDAFKATSAWSIPSDARLKTVLGDFTDGLDTICALPQSVRFQWNGKGGTVNDGTVYYGRLAQDVQPVAPYLIRSYEDKLDPEDAAPTTLLSANDSPLTEMLINAVKELNAQLVALTARVAALETP